jgi:hypothetical protein
MFEPAVEQCRTPDTCMPINGDGLYANRDFAIPKPKNTKRIILLGDSFAAGYGLKYQESLWYQLEHSFKENIEVVNFGFPGSTTEEQVENFFHNGKGPKYAPDMIILRFQCNDILPFTVKYGLSETYDIIDENAVLWPRALKNRFFRLGVYLIRNKFQKYYFSNKDKVIEKDIVAPLERLHDYTAANHVDVLVLGDYCEVDPEFDKKEFKEVYGTLWQTARGFKWHALDLCDTGIDFSDAKMYIPGDGHPSGLLNSLISTNIHDFMARNSLPGEHHAASNPPINRGPVSSVPFRVTDSIPRNGEKDVSRNPRKFVFVFNKPLNSETIKRNPANIIDPGKIYGKVSFSVSGNILEMKILCYDRYLDGNSNYSIKLNEAIESVEGNELTPYTLVFSTGSKINTSVPPGFGKDTSGYSRLCK